MQKRRKDNKMHTRKKKEKGKNRENIVKQFEGNIMKRKKKIENTCEEDKER